MDLPRTSALVIAAAFALAGCRTPPARVGSEPPRTGDALPSELAAASKLAAAGRIVGAVEAYSAYASAHRDDPRPWTAIGRLLVGNGQYADAVEALLEADRLEPGTSETDSWLALAIGRSGRPRDGMELARRTAAAMPASAIAHANLAELADDQGLLRDSVAARRVVVRALPDSAEAWRELGNACFAGKDFVCLSEVGSRLRAIAPEDPDALVWSALAVAVIGTDQEVETTEPELARWTRAHPDRFPGWYALGRLRKRLHDWDGARMAYLEAAKIAPDRGEAHADLAVIERMRGDRKASAISANRHRAALLARRRYEDAVRSARAAGAGSIAQLHAVEIAVRSGEMRVARECLARAASLAPGSAEVARWRNRLESRP